MGNIDQAMIGKDRFKTSYAVVSSGASCILMPPDIYWFFMGTYMSGGNMSLPDITLTIKGLPYTLGPHDYVVAHVPGSKTLCLGPNSQNFWLLGDVFHRAFKVTYSFGDKPQVGLPSRGPPDSVPW